MKVLEYFHWSQQRLVFVKPLFYTLDFTRPTFLLHLRTIDIVLESEKSRNWLASATPLNPIPVLTKVDGESDYPVEGLYKLFKACKDEAIEAAAADFPFVIDADYRELLRLDASRVDTALANSEWKAATVLAGSLLEALLLVALQRVNHSIIDTTCAAMKNHKDFKNKNVQSPIDLLDKQWSLVHYVAISDQLRMISPETAKQSDIAREFRNLIHPAKAERERTNSDRGTARAAAAAVDMAVRDLSKFQF